MWETLFSDSRKNLMVKGKGIAGKQWDTRHNMAIIHPDNQEKGLILMLEGLALVAKNHVQRYESVIGEDYFLGKAWIEGLRAARVMLNGDLGRLDAGTLDAAIVQLATSNGFSEDDV